MKAKIKNIALILIGSCLQAAAISNIHAFSDVTEGGTLGLTILIFHFTGISPAITSLIFDGLCYALGWKVMGKRFLIYSSISVLFYSFCYSIFELFAPIYPPILSSPLLCAIVGAIILGTGAGLAVMGGAATSGDDAFAMSISRKYKIKIQYVYLISDLLVLALSLTYIPLTKILYSVLTVILSGQIVGWIQLLKKE